MLRCASLKGYSPENLCSLTGRLDAAFRSRQTAAFMGAEGGNDLSVPVVLLDKGIDRHRQFAPPVRIAQENHIIVLDPDVGFDFRTCACSFLLLGNLNTAVLFSGIRLHGFYLKKIVDLVLTTHEITNNQDIKQIFLPMLPLVGTSGEIEFMDCIYKTLCRRGEKGGIVYV